MDLNILKQIIILKIIIWFYLRQWMRERGGEGERDSNVILLFSMFVMKSYNYELQ